MSTFNKRPRSGGNDKSFSGKRHQDNKTKKPRTTGFIDREVIANFDPVAFQAKTNWNWKPYFEELNNQLLAAPSSISDALIQKLISRSEDPTVSYTGSTQFMQKSVTPCFGRLKVHARDFIVREIGDDGKPVEITSTELPSEDVLFNNADMRKELEVSRLPEVLAQLQELMTEAGYAEFLTFVGQIENCTKQKVEARARIEELRAQQIARNASLTQEERDARFQAYALAKKESTAPVDEIDAEIMKCKEAASQVFPQMIVDGLKDPSNKDDRKKFHSLVREGYASLLLTDTIDYDFPQPDGSVARGPAIRVSSTKGDVNRHGSENESTRGRDKKIDLRSIADGKWPGGDNGYVKFALYKRNMDSNQSIDFLARQFRIAPWNIGYCGMKDKRAITVQWMTMHRMTAHRLRNAFIEYDRNHFLHRRLAKIDSGDCSFDPTAPLEKYQFDEEAHDTLPDMMVGNFKYVKNELKLGDHQGNNFEIVIRNVRPITTTQSTTGQISKPCMRAELNEISNDMTPLTTDEFTLLETTISKACEKLVQYGFLNYFGTQRFGSFQIPSHVFGVSAIKNDYARMFYLSMLNMQTNNPTFISDLEQGEAVKAHQALRHSFVRERSMLQSLIENGHNDYQNAYFAGPKLARTIFPHAYQSWIFNLMVSARMDPLFWDDEGKTDVFQPLVGDLVLDSAKESNSELIGVARPLTQADIDSGKYTLMDIVLPILRDIRSLPTNKTADVAHAVLKSDGITAEQISQCLSAANYDDSSKPRDYIYRPLVCKPTDFSFSLNRNVDGLVDLKLDFSLRPSAYATMLLREVLHSSLYTFYEEQKSIQAPAESTDAEIAE